MIIILIFSIVGSLNARTIMQDLEATKTSYSIIPRMRAQTVYVVKCSISVAGNSCMRMTGFIA